MFSASIENQLRKKENTINRTYTLCRSAQARRHPKRFCEGKNGDGIKEACDAQAKTAMGSKKRVTRRQKNAPLTLSGSRGFDKLRSSLFLIIVARSLDRSLCVTCDKNYARLRSYELPTCFRHSDSRAVQALSRLHVAPSSCRTFAKCPRVRTCEHVRSALTNPRISSTHRFAGPQKPLRGFLPAPAMLQRHSKKRPAHPFGFAGHFFSYRCPVKCPCIFACEHAKCMAA